MSFFILVIVYNILFYILIGELIFYDHKKWLRKYNRQYFMDKCLGRHCQTSNKVFFLREPQLNLKFINKKEIIISS